MTVVISQYPVLREEVEEKLSAFTDDFKLLPVANLSGGSYLGRLRALRSLDVDRAIVFLKDEESVPFQAILTVMSYFIRASNRFICYPDGTLKALNSIALLRASAAILSGVLIGFIYIVMTWLNLLALKGTPRVKVRMSYSDILNQNFPGLIYLHANPWSGLRVGGSVTHTTEVVSAFGAAGVDVKLLTNSPGSFSDMRAELVTIPSLHTYVVPREINHVRYTHSFYKGVISKLERTESVIYQRASQGQYAGLKLSRKWRLPLVIEYNGPENWMAKNWGAALLFPGLIRLVEDVNLIHAHAIVTVSEELKEDLVRRGVDERKIICQPNGADVDVFDPDRCPAAKVAAARKQVGFGQSDIVVTFLGTFGAWHGADVLAEAIRKIKRGTEGESPTRSRLKFLFIGDGGQRSAVETSLKQEIESGDVFFTGVMARKDVPTHLAASDICVMPTRSNPDSSSFFGSPTKLFEYMAMGRPIVASDLTQTQYVMEGAPRRRELRSKQLDAFPDAVGVLVHPDSADELVDAIECLAAAPETMRAMGKRARQKVLDDFTWQHHIRAIKASIFKMLQTEVTPVSVLINALHSKSGGGVTYLRNVLPHLAADPTVDVQVCLQRGQTELFAQDVEHLTLHYVNPKPGLRHLVLFEQFRLPFLAKKWGAEVIFSAANYGPLLPRNTVLLLRNALSVAFVERRPSKFAYWSMLYLVTVASLLRARLFIAVSGYAAGFARFGLSDRVFKRCTIIYHGIDERFRRASWKPGGDFLLAVSDLYVQKNLHTLFGAFVKVLDEAPDTKLKIAGAAIDREYTEQLYRMVDRLGIGSQVEFLGSVAPDVLVEYYTSCALFVFPSTVETFGNPLVEAMACGAPVACSNTAAMPEIAGDAVVYFNPRSPDEMASKILMLLRDPDARISLGQKARERAQRYSWKETARKTAEVLRCAADP